MQNIETFHYPLCHKHTVLHWSSYLTCLRTSWVEICRISLVLLKRDTCGGTLWCVLRKWLNLQPRDKGVHCLKGGRYLGTTWDWSWVFVCAFIVCPVCACGFYLFIVCVCAPGGTSICLCLYLFVECMYACVMYICVYEHCFISWRW